MVNPADAIQKAASIGGCIDAARAAGELDRARAIALKNTLEDLEVRYAQIMPPQAAAARAAQDIRAAVERGLPARYHSVLAQLQSMQRLRARIEASPDPDLLLKNMLSHGEGRADTGESVQSVVRAYVRSINAALHEVLDATTENMIGQSRDSQLLMRIIDELHGDDTGDAVARRLADQIRQQQERMREAFNAHGGNIGRLENFGVTHSHDVARMRRAGFAAWRDTIKGRLDWTRIEDFATGEPFARRKGQLPPDDVIDRFLRDVFETITTRGWNSREVTMGAQGRALYNRRGDHRVLHFQSGKAWRDYNAEFGDGDLFSSLVGGLHGIARDVALMRVLGPNPRMGLQFAESLAMQRAGRAADPELEARVESSAALARAMLAHTDGSANRPVSSAWGAFFSGARSALTSIQLGSAILSAPTDLATLTMAARHMGMNPANVLGRHVQLMASSATRQTAARMGYVADTLADAGANTSRYVGEMWVPNLARRLAGFTMRASGLSFWTDMARTAFQMEFAGALADMAPRAFAELPEPIRRAFAARGLTPADWDALRAPELLFTAENGATFLSPFHWLERQTTLPRDQAEGIAMRLQMLVEEQMEYAVPTANVEGTARMMMGLEPGSIPGELVRSFGMYKSFAVSLTLGQIRRFNAIPTRQDRLQYAAMMGAGLLMLGAVSVQLKDLAKGRDPRPMAGEGAGKFWMAALFQSGGLGIFGDFFSAETSRAGGGVAETLAGPVAGLGGDVVRLAAGPIGAMAAGEDPRIGRNLVNFARQNTPVFSSLWYARAAYDRVVADNFQRLVDPEAEANWRRQERARENNFGNRIWWDRGAALPFRAPDLSNATGATQ